MIAEGISLTNGPARQSARKLGISLQEYQAKIASGLGWCRIHRDWVPLSTIEKGRGLICHEHFLAYCKKRKV